MDNMDPREAAAKQIRDQQIAAAVNAKIIPGRSALEQPEFQGVVPVETSYGDGRPSGFTAELPDGRTLERVISYEREKGLDDRDHNTDNVAAVSEKIRTTETSDDGRTTTVNEVGKDLHRVHAWESVNTVNKNESGDVTGERTTGSVTEGEKAGEKWENVTTFETRGGITKRTRSNSGTHFEGDQLVPYRTEKVNYTGPNGEHILYRSREFDAAGVEKPDKLMEDKAENIPPDFQEW